MTEIAIAITAASLIVLILALIGRNSELKIALKHEESRPANSGES